jgi:DNA-binding NarL/FixJ family response regulator
VLHALCDGFSAEAIAEQQFVSVGTVRTHIQAVLRKLGVSSQLAAVVLARKLSWRSS